MRYFDTGGRDPLQTLAKWFEEVVQQEIVELRLQTGFFSIDGIALLHASLEQCRLRDRITKVLIGSNDASTLKSDIVQLVDALGIPRNGAQLGVVSFGGAFFHPKTYHIVRPDGSQAAYVGSANLTASGLALHVEAGIALDTREGDSPQHLSQIAAAIDSWFSEQRAGLTLVSSLQTVDDLVECGVLTLQRPPRPPSENRGDTTGGRPARPRLSRLYDLPVRQRIDQPEPQDTPVVASPISASLPSAPRNGFPAYLLFEPNATGPTVGVSALTGSLLPGGSKGLIIQLNRDSARHFMGRTGTANISIPVATISTFRFGVSGIHDRPTVKFDLHLRYIGDNVLIDGGMASTNVMGYGYTAQETGHGDIRMLVPAAVRTFGSSIEAAGLVKPTADDLAFLEWPTVQDPAFRLTFLDTQSTIYQQALSAFNNAAANGQVVGNGACWLAGGVSANW